MKKLKFKTVGDIYRTTEPMTTNVYGFVRKNENDFGANTIWAYGLCEKDGEVIEAIMTADTKKQAVKELGLYGYVVIHSKELNYKGVERITI